MDAFKNIYNKYMSINSNTPAENILLCSCGNSLIKDTSNYMCKNCGFVKDYEFADSEYENMSKDQSSVGRIRVVGQSCNYFQSDLYRSSNLSTSETQKAQISEEFLVHRLRYNEKNKNKKNKINFSIKDCMNAAIFYNIFQCEYVKRNQNKKSIMAVCLYLVCIQNNFVPPKSAVAEFMNLNTKGIAKGENFVRSFIADGKISIDVDINSDTCRPEIETIFMQLGYSLLNDQGEVIEDKYKNLKNIIELIVKTAEDEKIGNKSYKKSKVAGATFAVLKRCKDKTLIPKVPSIHELCDQKIIRKNTIESFLKELYRYHSTFEPIYIQYDLDSEAMLP